MKVEEMWF